VSLSFGVEDKMLFLVFYLLASCYVIIVVRLVFGLLLECFLGLLAFCVLLPLFSDFIVHFWFDFWIWYWEIFNVLQIL